MLAGESGIRAIQSFDVASLPAKIAGQVPAGTKADGGLDINEWIPVKDPRRWTGSSSSPWSRRPRRWPIRAGCPRSEEDRCRTGVMIGSGIGGLETIQRRRCWSCRARLKPHLALLHPVRADQPRLRPGLDPLRLQGTEPFGRDRLRHRRRMRIGDAARLIALGDADVMVAGGAEAAVWRTGHGRVLRGARAVDRISTTRPRRPPAPGTRTATAS